MAFRTAAAAGVLASVFAVHAQADWVREATSADCTGQARDRIAAGTRRQIESAVRRAEASISPPASVGDLSCLDGLMELPLDWFAPAGGLESLFSGSFDGVVGSGADARQICSFAERKWRQVTRPLTSPLDLLRLGLPPDLADAFDVARKLDSDNGHRRFATGRGRAGAASKSPKGAISDTPNGGWQEESGEDNPVDEIWRTLYGDGVSQ